MSRISWITLGALGAFFAAGHASAQTTVYVGPPVYVSPPAVVVAPAPSRTWVPAHWEGRGRTRAWVEGHWVTQAPRHAPGWNQVARRDSDRDGVPDRVDRDRDGDGVPNWRDRAPDNGWRR